jgi:hypothetical protein
MVLGLDPQNGGKPECGGAVVNTEKGAGIVGHKDDLGSVTRMRAIRLTSGRRRLEI